MEYTPFNVNELHFIATKADIVKSSWLNDHVFDYLNASEIAHYIKALYKRQSCSPQVVNKALLNCFGNTTLSEHWEIPQIVPQILYQKVSRGYYKWHKILIPVMDDQIFGSKSPLLLEGEILKLQSKFQQSSMN